LGFIEVEKYFSLGLSTRALLFGSVFFRERHHLLCYLLLLVGIIKGEYVLWVRRPVGLEKGL